MAPTCTKATGSDWPELASAWMSVTVGGRVGTDGRVQRKEESAPSRLLRVKTSTSSLTQTGLTVCEMGSQPLTETSARDRPTKYVPSTPVDEPILPLTGLW